MPRILLTPGINPLALGAQLWPRDRLYDRQREIVMSVEENAETYVPSANMMGKDYVTGFIVLNLFLRCFMAGKTCRIVTTSVAGDHLDVLWGEISGWVQRCRTPLNARRGGPLVINHMEITRAADAAAGIKDPVSYLKGIVAERPEKMQGHHAQVTLFVGDESSGLRDEFYAAAQGWARRMLFIGNTNPTENFFRRNCEAGDLPNPAVPQGAN